MAKVEPRQDTFRIGQATDNFASRGGTFPHDSGKSQNLIAMRNLRLFQQVDDLDLIAAGKVVFAQLLEISKGGDRLRRRAGHVEAQCPFFLRSRGRVCFKFSG